MKVLAQSIKIQEIQKVQASCGSNFEREKPKCGGWGGGKDAASACNVRVFVAFFTDFRSQK